MIDIVQDQQETPATESNAIEVAAKRKSVAVPKKDATPLALIQMAVQQGADIDYLQKLMELQERHEANEAKKAFHSAFASFKAEAVKILRNKAVTDGPLKGKSYAELFSVVDAVSPAMAKHGLSHAWEITKDDKDWIEVTCIISHELGHSKAVKLGGPPDTGGAKNSIQARISTVSYLERATLKAACGVAEQGDDKDGNSTVSQEQELSEKAADWIASVQESIDLAQLQQNYTSGFQDLTKAKDNYGKNQLIKAKDAKKKELSNG